MVPVTRRLGRPHLGVLSAAALAGALAAAATIGASPGFAAHADPAHADPAHEGTPAVAEVPPRPVTVDAQLIRSVARRVLLEQDQPAHLTDVDLIARDVTALGPLSPGEVEHVTRQTLLGFGPGGPAVLTATAPPRCPPTARACIDVDAKRAWVVSEGHVTYGPVPITTGMPGYETARGSHRVLRHVRHDHSRIFDSPMPYSTYFTTSGMAFHEGRLDEPSHGCIHLGHHAAAHFFEQLRVGDEVFAY